MVAAPLATGDVNVDLPDSTAERIPRPDDLLKTLEEDNPVSLAPFDAISFELAVLWAD